MSGRSDSGRGSTIASGRLWSWSECRTAAAAVLGARHGPDAVRRLRGRGINRIHAERAPLPIVLWLASRQDLLLSAPVSAPGGFALLRPPLRVVDERHTTFTAGVPNAGHAAPATARLGRWAVAKIDRHWQHVAAYAPAVVLLLASGLLAVLPWRPVLVVALLLSVAGLCWTIAMLGIGAVRGGGDLRADLEGRRSVRDAVTARTGAGNWAVALLHADGSHVDVLLELAIAHHERTTRVGMLLLRRSGITTPDARHACEGSRFVTEPEARELDRDVLVLFRRADDVLDLQVAREQVVRPTGGITVVGGGILLAAPVLALLLSQVDGAVCARGGCPPDASYLQTLLWTFDQFLPLGGPLPGVVAGSGYGWFLGELIAVLGAVFVGCVVVAILDVRRFNREIGSLTDTKVEVTLSQAQRDAFDGVFVNYRATGAAAIVQGLRDRLVGTFHTDKVFLDVVSMKPGSRYPDELRAGLARSEVLLCLVHRTWLAELKDPRLDWVLFEIRHFLASGKTIIPVLLDGAVMPRADQMDAEYREFTLRQAAPLRTATAAEDIASLVDVVATAAQRRSAPGGPTSAH